MSNNALSGRHGLKRGFFSTALLALSTKSFAENASGSLLADLSSLNGSLVRVSGDSTIGIGFIVNMDGQLQVYD